MSNKILIETSARHLHITQADLEVLFGAGAQLTRKKDLSQPGQYACEERVTVVGPKKSIEGVSILGPTRPVTQVEISLTDARSIGIAAPIRESGDIAGSASCKLIGPKGEIEMKEGVIVAKRHLHITPTDATAMNVADKEIVCVKIASEARSLVLDDVVVRVSESFSASMHIDTDEANAAGISGEVYGEVIKK
jgi:putative phosphotransacetylase